METSARRQATLRQRFLGGVAWAGFSRGFVVVLGFGVTVVLARLLSPQDYGVLSMAMVFIGIAQQARDFGVGQALIRMERVTVEAQKTAFSYAFLASGLIYLLLLLSADAIGAFFRNDRVASVLRVAGLAFPLTAFTVVPTAMLRRELTLRGEAMATAASTVLDSAATIALAMAGWGVWALVIGKLIGQISIAVFLGMASPWRPGLRFFGEERGEMLGFGGGVTLSGLLWYVYTNADFLIVGKALGETALGYYTMAWNLAKMPWDRLWNTISPLVLPLFARSRTDRRELGRVLCRVTHYLSLITFPAVAGLAAVSSDAVEVLLGPKWRPVTVPLIWLCVFGLSRTVAVLWAPVLLSAGRVGQAVRFNIACVIVLPLGFMAGVRFGIAGVAVAWALLYPLLAVLWLFPQALAVAGVAPARYLTFVLAPTVATLFMVLAVVASGLALPLGSGPRLAVRVAVGCVVYLGVTRLMVGSLFQEIGSLLRETRQGITA